VSSSALSTQRVAPNAADDPMGEFGASVAFVNKSAVLSARGARDQLSSFKYGPVLDNVVERHQSVVLDLTELAFAGASGFDSLRHTRCTSRHWAKHLSFARPHQPLFACPSGGA
jgi:hypothetical protein